MEDGGGSGKDVSGWPDLPVTGMGALVDGRVVYGNELSVVGRVWSEDDWCNGGSFSCAGSDGP